MCNNRNAVFVSILGMNDFKVDLCMFNLIHLLNQVNNPIITQTLGCCCGHGKYQERQDFIKKIKRDIIIFQKS